MNNNISIKINFNGFIKRVSLPEKYSDLLETIKSGFEVDLSTVSIFYKDDEDDKIFITNQFDWEQALLLQKKEGNKVFKLYIIDKDKVNESILPSPTTTVHKGDIDRVSLLTDVNSKEQVAKENVNEKLNHTEILNTCPEKKERKRVKKCKKTKKEQGESKQSQVVAQIQPSQTEVKKDSNVHEGVECDGCNVCPIVGNRYKCTICNNFDYCEKCEETKPHEHAFLKIKTVQQAPTEIYCKLPNGIHMEKILVKPGSEGMVKPMKKMIKEIFTKKFDDHKDFENEFNKQISEFSKTFNDFNKKFYGNYLLKDSDPLWNNLKDHYLFRNRRSIWDNLTDNVNSFFRILHKEDSDSEAKKQIKEEPKKEIKKEEQKKEETPGEDIIIEEVVDTKTKKAESGEDRKKEESKSEKNDDSKCLRFTEKHLRMLKYLRKYYDLRNYTDEQILAACVKADNKPDNVFVYLLR